MIVTERRIMTRVRVLIVAIAVAAIALGAIRDFVLINLNYCIDHLVNHRAVNYAHSIVRNAVADLPLEALKVLKWAFSIGFVLAMLGLSIALARTLYRDHRYTRWLVAAFGGVALVALALQFGAHAIPALGVVSVKLLHLLQYPVVLFFIWASTWLPQRT